MKNKVVTMTLNAIIAILITICISVRYFNLCDSLNLVCDIILGLSIILLCNTLWDLIVILENKLRFGYIISTTIEFIILIALVIAFRFLIKLDTYEKYISNYSILLITFGYVFSLILGFIEYYNKNK